jgi:hypothetical protein
MQCVCGYAPAWLLWSPATAHCIRHNDSKHLPWWLRALSKILEGQSSANQRLHVSMYAHAHDKSIFKHACKAHIDLAACAQVECKQKDEKLVCKDMEIETLNKQIADLRDYVVASGNAFTATSADSDAYFPSSRRRL